MRRLTGEGRIRSSYGERGGRDDLGSELGDPFAAHLRHFEGLIGERRTGVTFGAVVKGIIGARSLVCERIAAHSEILMCSGPDPSVAPYGFGPIVHLESYP